MSGDGVKTITIPPDFAGGRADSALSEMLPQSRSRLAALIKSGSVLMDGKSFKPSTLVEGGEKIEIEIPRPEPGLVSSQDIALDVIFEDSDLIVVNKPAGMVVHPGAGRSSGTLANALAYRCLEISLAGGDFRPGIVHRLDKDTSGVIVAAKNDVCHASLASQFAQRTVRKEYAALVCGAMRGNSGVFSSPIGRSISNRKKMSGKTSAKTRDCLTHWETIEIFPDWTFVKVTPKTGRTHQIRVHFSEDRHPVAADALYSDKTVKLSLASSGLSKILKRQALHASSISLRHPSSGKDVSFSAPLPEDIASALSYLRSSV